MTRKIAIVKSKELSTYDDYTKIVDSISDWSEVSDEDFEILRKASSKNAYGNNAFIIIERVQDENFILKTVKDYIEFERKELEKQLIAKEEAEAKKQERLLKKKAKDEAAELKLLEQLEKKHRQNV